MPIEYREMEYREWLAISFCLALGSLLLPFFGPLFIAVPLATAWLVTVCFAVVVYGKRGLRFLLASPLALFWPIMFVLYHFGYVDFP
jgi:hypothetical protein